MEDNNKTRTDILELSDQGKGRVFIVLSEPTNYQALAKELLHELAQVTRCILLEVPEVNNNNWRDLTKSLMEYLAGKGIRQASFVAFSDASSIILNLSLNDLKLVRSMVIVDAATRPHPSIFQRFIDKVENVLPLGLPLRSYGKGFDAKSFLQRMRCPVLVVTSSHSGQYVRNEAEIFKAGLPTAWALSLGANNAAHELREIVLEFQQTPAKCPQKGSAKKNDPQKDINSLTA